MLPCPAFCHTSGCILPARTIHWLSGLPKFPWNLGVLELGFAGIVVGDEQHLRGVMITDRRSGDEFDFAQLEGGLADARSGF